MIFTATARSGTGYISKLLLSANYNCTHEEIFECSKIFNGFIPPIEHSDSSWLAAPLLFHYQVPIYQIVRDPIKVIHSIRKMRFFQRNNLIDLYIAKHLPGLREFASIEEKILFYWMRWNKIMIEPFAKKFYRIEDITADPKKFLDELGITNYKEEDLFKETEYNHRLDYEIDLTEFRKCGLWSEFKNIAKHYGYEI